VPHFATQATPAPTPQLFLTLGAAPMEARERIFSKGESHLQIHSAALCTQEELGGPRGLLRNDSAASGAKEEDGRLPGACVPAAVHCVERPASEEVGANPYPTAGEPASLGPPASTPVADDSPGLEAEPQLESAAEQPAEGSRGRGEAVREDDRDLDWVVWSYDDVSEWIDLLLGDGMGESFRRNKVDGPTLLELTEDDLRVCLEIGNPLHRQKIMGHVRVFQMRRARLAQHAARRRLAEEAGRSVSRQASPGQDSSPPQLLQQPLEAPQNGNALSFSPPSRKKQGRGNSHSVDRLYVQAANTFSNLSPDSVGQASSMSVDSRPMNDDERGGFSTSNRFSRFTNPSRCTTTGLISCFGLDSPSFSLRGSWPTAPVRRCEEQKGPGPCSYNVVSNLENFKSNSPRATIGNTTRNTSEHFVGANNTIGGSNLKFLQNQGRGKVKGGVIGTGPRWAASNGRNPGPAAYRPRQNFSSTFK